MKNAKSVIIATTIVLSMLVTSIVYATTTHEALDSFSGTTDQTMELLTGTKNNSIQQDGNKETNNSKNTTNESPTRNTEKEKTTATSKIVDATAREKKTIEDYQQAYGSDSYGLTAYILSRIQIYSIPFCFLGIAISAIYQYVLGIRKLDTRDKGFAIMISIITLFVIAQVLPLIFAIVVKGWRG